MTDLTFRIFSLADTDRCPRCRKALAEGEHDRKIVCPSCEAMLLVTLITISAESIS